MTNRTAAALMRGIALSFFLFALAWATSSYASIDAPGRFLTDLLKWPIDGEPGAFDQMDRWMSAIGAGLLGAFAAFSFFVVAPGLEEGDDRVRRGAVAAIVTWFVIDSAGSIASGVASNAVFNAPFLALYLLPLLALGAARKAAA